MMGAFPPIYKYILEMIQYSTNNIDLLPNFESFLTKTTFILRQLVMLIYIYDIAERLQFSIIHVCLNPQTIAVCMYCRCLWDSI